MANKFGIVAEQLVSPAVRALNEEEAQAPKPPTEAEKLRQQQGREKIQFTQRQQNDMTAAKIRDLQDKTRKQQSKQNQAASTATKSEATAGDTKNEFPWLTAGRIIYDKPKKK